MKKILVVDDDVDMLTVVMLILTENGFSVEATCDPEETFQKIAAFEPDIILLDVLLGNYNGCNISKQIKTTSLIKQIPVILFSVDHNIKNNLEVCYADGFIGKPFDNNYLVTKINFHLISLN